MRTPRVRATVPALLLAASASLCAQAPPGDTAFQQTVQPFFTKSCYGCHNEKLSSANLNLQSLTAASEPQLLDKIRDKLATGKMPPPGTARPAPADIAAVTAWIEGRLKRAGYNADSNPGRVMARRLNRVEYNNTIRDLLAVAARPADEFPVDDSGYGFDNIADVLTVSPMLMEKYMSAARTVSRLAVFGETLPDKPTRLARMLARRSQGNYDVLEEGNFGAYLPYSLRGAMYGSWVFPVDAEYEFRLRVVNFRRAGVKWPTRKVALTLDGVTVLTDVVEGDTNFGYARGEFTARIPVTAGAHMLRASYPELADLASPRENINNDLRRGLFIDYLDIVGPFNPSKEPAPSYRKIFVCGHAPGKHLAACSRPIVGNLLRRAWRRPATPLEVAAKLRLATLAAKEGDSFEEGIRLALEATLASPDFLFRIERDPITPSQDRILPQSTRRRSASGGLPPRQGPHAINGYELASRLSYFLWASMPDDELLRLAASGTLSTLAVFEPQVRRMLADAKASNLVDNFAAQWLQLRNLARTKPDPVRFPNVDDELLDAMRRETSLFVAAIIKEDRSLLDFIDAPFTYVNGPLARHYGIEGVNGEEFQRVTLDPEKRGGLLTQGAILTVSSYPTRTSPPVRGKWVLENLLGAAPPPPPPDVPVLDESKLSKTASMRERMEQHRKDPSCAPCHNAMDPIGFGLESYDATGAWRAKEGEAVIDTSGTLPDGHSFRGARDLKQILRSQSDAFTRNLTEKLLTFALGRGLEPYDRATVDQIVRRVAAGNHRFSTLVLEIANSKPFRMRTSEGSK